METRRDKDDAAAVKPDAATPHEPVEVQVPRPDDIPCRDLPLASRIEALLVGTDRPLGEARLSAVLALPGKGTAAQVREAIEQLNAHYAETGRAFRIERLAGGWQILTLADYGSLLARMHADRQQSRLSQAALETLSIIAYRQPIMRAEIEAIRGVACGEVLRGLLERRLVKIVGRAEELGRPMLYGTTRTFLSIFGLSGLDDLPVVEGAKREKGVSSDGPRPPQDDTGVRDEPAGNDPPGLEATAEPPPDHGNDADEQAPEDRGRPIDRG